MFVVDASVALAWCFTDESNASADRALERLAEDSALAPSIWPFEVANGLRTAERGGRLGPGDLARLRELLRALPVYLDVVDLETAVGEVLAVARSLDLTAYDAAYLTLASRRGLALATVDARLRRACLRAGVQLLE
ncbi:MAG TPA: type II toxin-antitoxin system VapC family toxin [Candidatus Limnocylindrales bacterium]